MCQTGGLMWLMSANRPAASDGGPVISHTRHPVGDRRVPSRCFDTCVTAPETRPLPAVSRAQSACDVDRLSSGIRRGKGDGDSPARRPRADGHYGSLIALPPYPPPAVLVAPPSAVSIVRRQRWGPVIGRERRRVRPAIAPSPRSPTAEAQAADHSLITSVRLSARAFLHQTAWRHSCQLNFASLWIRFYQWSVNKNTGMRGVKLCGRTDRRQH